MHNHLYVCMLMGGLVWLKTPSDTEMLQYLLEYPLPVSERNVGINTFWMFSLPLSGMSRLIYPPIQGLPTVFIDALMKPFEGVSINLYQV